MSSPAVISTAAAAGPIAILYPLPEFRAARAASFSLGKLYVLDTKRREKNSTRKNTAAWERLDARSAGPDGLRHRRRQRYRPWNCARAACRGMQGRDRRHP